MSLTTDIVFFIVICKPSPREHSIDRPFRILEHVTYVTNDYVLVYYKKKKTTFLKHLAMGFSIINMKGVKKHNSKNISH